MQPSFARRLLAELVGTFGFFFLGFMGVATAVTHPARSAAAASPPGSGSGSR